MENHTASRVSEGPLDLDDEAIAGWAPRRSSRPSALFIWVRYRDPEVRDQVVVALAPVLRTHGVTLTWAADLREVFIGAEAPCWHEALILSAPEHGALQAMVSSVAYSRVSLSLNDAVAETQVLGVRPATLPAVARGALGLFRAAGPLYRRLRRQTADMGGLETPGGVNPTHAQVAAMVENHAPGAVTMINLLAYRERAAYVADGGGPVGSGRQAYQRYGQVAVRGVSLLGGRVVFLGHVKAALRSGPGAPDTAGPWDELAIVEYPSRQSFTALAATPGYMDATHHRYAGLARTTLVVSEPWAPARLGRV